MNNVDENRENHTPRGTCGLSAEVTKRKRKTGHDDFNKENICSSQGTDWQPSRCKNVMEDSFRVHSPLSPMNGNRIPIVWHIINYFVYFDL